MVVKITDEKSGKEIEYTEKFWANKKALKIDGQELNRLNQKIFEDAKTKEQFTLKGSSSFGLYLVNAKSQHIELIRKLWIWEFFLMMIPFLSISVGTLAFFFQETNYWYGIFARSFWISAVFGLAGFLYAAYNIRKYEKWYFKLLMCVITLIICAVLGVLLTMFAAAVLW